MIPASTRVSGEPLWRVSLETPDEASAEAFMALLDTLGGIVSAFEVTPTGPWKIESIVQGKPDITTVAGNLPLVAVGYGVPEPKLALEQLPDLDWVRLNQESFPPLRLGRYFVHGSHIRDRVPTGLIGLQIDAATAFGTGEHATTAGCLLALTRLARRGRRRRVLDMGTGTGILGIAAAKTWRVPVVACDIDRHSVDVARENAEVNGVGSLLTCRPSDGYQAAEVRQGAPYDLIFANILARPLARMAPDLARNLAPGGVAILSGLLANQEVYVCSAHRRDGLIFRGRIARNGWHTLIFEKGIL